jgi:hypothetical protein
VPRIVFGYRLWEVAEQEPVKESVEEPVNGAPWSSVNSAVRLGEPTIGSLSSMSAREPKADNGSLLNGRKIGLEPQG